jgi:hypothetical protein
MEAAINENAVAFADVYARFNIETLRIFAMSMP